MKKGVVIVGIGFILMVLFLSSIDALPKKSFRDFLKTELKNYFEDKPTLLTANELREITDFYFSLSDDEENIDLNKSELSKSTINIIENALNIISKDFLEGEIKEETIKKRLRCCIEMNSRDLSFFKLIRFIISFKNPVCTKDVWTECSENPSCENLGHKCTNMDCGDYLWGDKGYQIGSYPKEEICS